MSLFFCKFSLNFFKFLKLSQWSGSILLCTVLEPLSPLGSSSSTTVCTSSYFIYRLIYLTVILRNRLESFVLVSSICVLSVHVAYISSAYGYVHYWRLYNNSMQCTFCTIHILYTHHHTCTCFYRINTSLILAIHSSIALSNLHFKFNFRCVFSYFY